MFLQPNLISRSYLVHVVSKQEPLLRYSVGFFVFLVTCSVFGTKQGRKWGKANCRIFFDEYRMSSSATSYLVTADNRKIWTRIHITHHCTSEALWYDNKHEDFKSIPLHETTPSSNMVATSDYYAQGNKDLATETALTVQRLEPVCLPQLVESSSIAVWLNTSLIFLLRFLKLCDCPMNYSEVA